LTAIGAFRVASTVTAVDFSFSVQEEDHERQVVVELKQIQVCVVNSGESNPYELAGELFEALETDNLPVKFPTGRSWHAAYHDHKRLAGPACLSLPLLQCGEPTILSCRLRVAAPRHAGLSHPGGARKNHKPECQAYIPSTYHEQLSHDKQRSGQPEINPSREGKSHGGKRIQRDWRAISIFQIKI
jgi:hypothetical protein